MNEELPEVIRTYTQAIVDNTSELFNKCFAEDAVVSDAGKTYTGITSIKEWGDELSKMKLKTDVTNVTADDTIANISTHVSGDFKRSPLSFLYSIVLKDNKIQTLDIKVVE